MKRSPTARLLTGLSAAALATTGIALAGPAHAVSTQGFLSYVDGWRVGQHVRELADVNGDGRADVVAFGDPGVFVALGQTNGTFAAPVLRVRDFGTAQGWRTDRHPRTVADVDGDGRDDLVGFGYAGVIVSYAQPDGSFTAPRLKVRDFGWDQGWRVDRHVRELADLSGNGTADIVGFGYSGVTVSHGRADRTFDGTGKRIDSYGWDRGWRIDKNPRLLADMDGNGTADIVGFGDAGVYVSRNNGNATFQPPQLVVANFSYNAGGWRVDRDRKSVV